MGLKTLAIVGALLCRAIGLYQARVGDLNEALGALAGAAPDGTEVDRVS